MPAPKNPNNTKAVEQAAINNRRRRLDRMIAELRGEGYGVVVPGPALTEAQQALQVLSDAARIVQESSAAIRTATTVSTLGEGTRPYDRAPTRADRRILDPLGWDADWDDRGITPKCEGDAGLIEQAAEMAILHLGALEQALNERVLHYSRIRAAEKPIPDGV